MQIEIKKKFKKLFMMTFYNTYQFLCIFLWCFTYKIKAIKVDKRELLPYKIKRLKNDVKNYRQMDFVQ